MSSKNICDCLVYLETSIVTSSPFLFSESELVTEPEEEEEEHEEEQEEEETKKAIEEKNEGVDCPSLTECKFQSCVIADCMD